MSELQRPAVSELSQPGQVITSPPLPALCRPKARVWWAASVRQSCRHSPFPRPRCRPGCVARMPRRRPAPWHLRTAALRHVTRAAACGRCGVWQGRGCVARRRCAAHRAAQRAAHWRCEISHSAHTALTQVLHARQALSAWPSTMRGAVTTPAVAMLRRSSRARAALVRRAGAVPPLSFAHLFLLRAAGAGGHRRRGAAREERGHDGAGRRADGLHRPLRHQGADLARLQGAPPGQPRARRAR